MVKEPINRLNPDFSKVSLIIPAYNEELAIGKTLEQLTQDDDTKLSEIIIINDGSTDNTKNEVSKYQGVRLINHVVNRGYGSALVTGMKNSTRDFVVWMDSDGQHRVEDVVTLVKKMLHEDLDYCVGIRGASSHQEPSRKFGKWVLKMLVSLVAGQVVRDFNSGLRGFKRSTIIKYLHLLPKGFGASTTTTLIMSEASHKGGEVPITVLQRLGKSSVKQFRDGMRTINMIFHIFLLFRPLHFFGTLGFFMFLWGICYGFIKALLEGKGFPVLAAVLLLSGLQTIFMGFIMDHISAIRRERFNS